MQIHRFFLLLEVLNIFLTNARIDFLSILNTGTNGVKTVSQSFGTLTLITYNYTMGPTNTYTTLYDLGTNNGVIIQTFRAWTYGTFRQLKGYNTLGSNAYLVYGKVNGMLSLSNFTSTAYTFNYANTTVSQLQACFGNSSTIFYQMLQYPTNFTVLQCTKPVITYTCTTILSFSGQQIIDIQYYQSKLYVYSCSQADNSNSILRIYDSMFSLLTSLNFTNVVYSYAFLQVNDEYIAINANTTIYIYNITNNFTFAVSFVVPGTIVYDMKLTNLTIIISVDSTIFQYSMINGVLFANFSSPNGVVGYNISVVTKYGVMVLWKTTLPHYYHYSANDTYMCDYSLGCTCMQNYCFNDELTQCLFGGYGVPCPFTPLPLSDPNFTNSKNVTNSSIFENGSSINTSDNTTNTNNMNNNINSTNTTKDANNTNSSETDNNTTNFSYPVINYSVITAIDTFGCFSYSSNNHFCTAYCKYSCKNCQNSWDYCTECQYLYTINEAGECKMETKTQATLSMLSAFNIFRIQNAQRAYFFVNGLDLYNYHKANYTGIVSQVLSFVGYFQDYCWNILNFPMFLDWANSKFSLPDYNAWTNPKFIYQERKDLIFFQNTKSYFFIYIPITSLCFICANRLFYLLFQKKISAMVRIYSFWLYLVFMLVNQNINMIVFLAARNYANLFSFDIQLRVINGLFIIVIGIIFILALTVLPLSSYFYGKLNKYFFTSLFRLQGAMVLTVIRFCIKPIIQSLLHAFFFENQVLQLALLSTNSFTHIILLSFFEYKCGIYRKKCQFICDILIESNTILLNIFLTGKHYLYPEIADTMECCLRTVIYTYIFLSVFYLLNPITDIFEGKKIIFEEQLNTIRCSSVNLSIKTAKSHNIEEEYEIESTYTPSLANYLELKLKKQSNTTRNTDDVWKEDFMIASLQSQHAQLRPQKSVWTENQIVQKKNGVKKNNMKSGKFLTSEHIQHPESRMHITMKKITYFKH